MILSPKKIYLMLIVLGAILMTFDHLTSNALTDVGSPSELGNACAPCGAPYLITSQISSKDQLFSLFLAVKVQA